MLLWTFLRIWRPVWNRQTSGKCRTRVSSIIGLLRIFNFRYSYDSEYQQLIIKAASENHECGVKVLQKFFESAMEAQQQGQEETIGWEYGTNATHHIRVLRENGQWRPTKDTITPDGSIYDPLDSLTLVIEVSNGQAMSDARAKIVKTMKMNTVVGGIILNLNESPAYSHPKPAEWNPRDEHTFMLAKEFGQQPHERWGAMTVQGYQFGGSIEGSMEVIQRDKAPVYAVSDELEILTLSF
jgi:hypothetical protein